MGESFDSSHFLAPAGGRLPQEEGIPSAPSLPPNCIDSLPPFHKVGILDENHSDSSLFSLRPHRTAAAAAMTAKGQPLPRSGPSHVIQR